MALQFDRTIKAGDILTSMTVMLSVIALVLSLAKDRATRVSDQANRVRAAAASAIVKLDRWQAVQLSMYQELQPTFVELSEELAKQYDVVATRDKFWRQVNLARARVNRQVLDEQLATAYADIVTHFPTARTKVIGAITEISGIEQQSSEVFLAKAERAILDLKGKQATYQTADLGNALREAAKQGSQQLKNESDRVLNPVRTYLFGLIEMRDDAIVSTPSQ